MGPAFATKLARHWAFEIGTREFAGFAARVTKALRRHEHEHVRRAAADVLAFAAMALRLEARFALCHVAPAEGVAQAFRVNKFDTIFMQRTRKGRNGRIAMRYTTKTTN